MSGMCEEKYTKLTHGNPIHLRMVRQFIVPIEGLFCEANGCANRW